MNTDNEPRHGGSNSDLHRIDGVFDSNDNGLHPIVLSYPFQVRRLQAMERDAKVNKFAGLGNYGKTKNAVVLSFFAFVFLIISLYAFYSAHLILQKNDTEIVKTRS